MMLNRGDKCLTGWGGFLVSYALQPVFLNLFSHYTPYMQFSKSYIKCVWREWMLGSLKIIAVTMFLNLTCLGK